MRPGRRRFKDSMLKCDPESTPICHRCGTRHVRGEKGVRRKGEGGERVINGHEMRELRKERKKRKMKVKGRIN